MSRSGLFWHVLLALPWQGTRYTDGGLFAPMELSAGLLLVSVLPLSSAQKNELDRLW